MKKIIFILLVATLFAGCKKDDPAVLDREKFIGNWTGTQTVMMKMNGVTYPSETTATTEKIDAGTDANQILFGKNTDEEIKANVSGSTFSIPTQLKSTNYDGSIISAEFYGNGTLGKNGVLTLSYTMDFKDGTIFTVTETLNKN